MALRARAGTGGTRGVGASAGLSPTLTSQRNPGFVKAGESNIQRAAGVYSREYKLLIYWLSTVRAFVHIFPSAFDPGFFQTPAVRESGGPSLPAAA